MGSKVGFQCDRQQIMFIDVLLSNNKLNATGRSLRDRFAILESRNPAPYREKLKWITPIFPNGTETPPLNFQGFDILVDEEDSEKLHIIVVNHRPSLDPATGALLDQEKVGPNSTFEYFETLVGNDTMVHKRTFVHSSIRTPSHIAWVDKNLFLFTNTHDSKVRSVGFSCFAISTSLTVYRATFFLPTIRKEEVSATVHLLVKDAAFSPTFTHISPMASYSAPIPRWTVLSLFPQALSP